MGRPKKVTKESPSLNQEIHSVTSSEETGQDGTPTIQSKTTTTEESSAIEEKKTPVRTLDRNRDFATIMGPTKNGARYEQDGFAFNVKGELIETD